MGKFPLKEVEILALANDMAAGLGANAAIYPAPPVAPADLQTAMAPNITPCDAAAAEEEAATKNETFQALADDMKNNLCYAEQTLDYDDKQLNKVT